MKYFLAILALSVALALVSLTGCSEAANATPKSTTPDAVITADLQVGPEIDKNKVVTLTVKNIGNDTLDHIFMMIDYNTTSIGVLTATVYSLPGRIDITNANLGTDYSYMAGGTITRFGITKPAVTEAFMGLGWQRAENIGVGETVTLTANYRNTNP